MGENVSLHTAEEFIQCNYYFYKKYNKHITFGHVNCLAFAGRRHHPLNQVHH